MEAKTALRQAARVRRAELQDGANESAYRDAARHLTASVLADAMTNCDCFAGYAPIGTEFDPRPVLDHCLALGLDGALPVTAGRRQMEFQRWTPATVLEPSRFGVPVPSPPSHAVRPDLVFVPLLAADRKGWRLGYGAGYYDFALRQLRRDGGDLIAVGLCFEGQLVDAVPRHDGDERLDWIVTEAGVFRTIG